MLRKIPEKKYNESDSLPRRDIFAEFYERLVSDNDKVLLLYGLRRTGKTTMMMQAISGLGRENVRFLQCEKGDSFSALKKELDDCLEEDVGYVFIDEVTKLERFVNTSSVLYDYYAANGLKIVLSGTDSLGLYLAHTDELYDRSVMFHTTYISFAEFCRLSGKTDLDDFIRYGGVLSHEKDEKARVFYDRSTASRYLDTAISNNITNSFFGSELPKSFRYKYDRLVGLHRANALESCINRITEIYSGTVREQDVKRLMQEEFVSHDLKSALQLLETRNIFLLPEGPDRETNQTVAYYLSAQNGIEIDDETVRQVKSYLCNLDLLKAFAVRIHDEYGGATKTTEEEYIVQPGMRYCQSKAIAEEFDRIGLPDSVMEKREEFLSTLDNDVKGKILETIVLADTRNSLDTGRYDVFKQRFEGERSGEIDMVIADKKEKKYYCFEIKHDTGRSERQRRHLTYEKYQETLSKTYGHCRCRCVLYRGNKTTENGVRYVNVADFLKELWKSKNIEKTVTILQKDAQRM